MSFKIDLTGIAKGVVDQVNAQLPGRASRASVKIRNAVLDVLDGDRIGRTYKTPTGGRYTASAPGEPPAWRTGHLAGSWIPLQSGPGGYNPAIESNVEYAWLDQGSPGGMIAPRPYEQKTLEKAWPEVEAIYQEPFDIDV